MNTKRLVINTATLSLCSLMLSNCASIKELRDREDPHAMVKKTKTVKVTKQKKKGGFFGFLSNLREDPKNKKSLSKPATTAIAKKAAKKVTPRRSNPVATVRTKPRYTATLPTLPVRKSVARETTAIKGQRRQANGLMMPDAGTLPTKKDLQEVQAPTLRKKGTPGINIPTQP